MANHYEVQKYKDIFSKVSASGESALDPTEKMELNNLNDSKFNELLAVIEAEKQKSPNSALLKSGGDYYEFIAAYEKAKDTINQKNTLSETTKTKLSTLMSQVPAPQSGPQSTAQTKPTEVVDTKKMFTELKKKLDAYRDIPITVDSISTILKGLESEKDPLRRAFIVNFVWSKLANAGYIMSIANNEVVLHNDNEKENDNTVYIQRALNTHIEGNKLSLPDIQSAIMTGTRKFGAYVEAQKESISTASVDKYVADLTQKLKITLAKSGNKLQSIASIEKSSATPEEKAFLISYVNGGYTRYNIVPDVLRSLELKKQELELKTGTVYQAVETSVATVAGPALKKEKEEIAKAGPEEELTIESVMSNPMRAITKYPWTALTLISASIWQFGFGKTIFGLFAGFLGIKAVNELGNTELGKQMKKGVEKGTKDAVNTVTNAVNSAAGSVAAAAAGSGTQAPAAGPANVPTNTIDISKLSDQQNKVYNKLKSDNELVKKIDDKSLENKKYKKAETGDFNAYMNFIFSDKIQSIKLEKLIYTREHKQGIFSSEGTMAIEVGAPNILDNNILKILLRTYIIQKGKLDLVSGQPQGKKERDEFESKYSATEYKEKTLHDITKIIYK